MQPPASAFETVLLDERALSRNDVANLRRHAERHQVPPADALVALGLMAEGDAYGLLARATGLPLVPLENAQPSELALRLVPERLARRHMVVPLQVDNRTLTYATCRPFDIEAERDLSFASGRSTSSVLTPSAVLAALDRVYPKLRELERLADRLRSDDVVIGSFDLGSSDTSSGSPVIDFCNQLIGRAVDVGASDVHIDFTTTGASVRYRICGALEPVMTLPASASNPVRNRLKIMARADIAVRFRPQDGAFRLSVNGRPIDVRLSSLPTIDGEKLVLRVIDSQSTPTKLDRLGYDPETLAWLQRSLARPDGLVLVTGPTGSGKSTVLYAALDHLRTAATNIVSVEDPVERTVQGVAQIPVNARAGNSFAAILKSMLRQDPNIIMVGEVRDAEVAQIVGQAAYTGHLVLTSLHTTDAATAVTRLMNLGLEPFKIAESLVAILAQRLVRSLCPHCRHVNDEFEARRLGQAHHLPAIPASAGPGCDRCKQTGYARRVPIAELLTPSDALRATIAQGATAHEIRTAMRAAGTPSMRQRALDLVAAGITSIEEIDRVLSAADDEQAGRGGRSRQRVLVVDDEAITRMLVKLLLEREQYEVIEAANGRDAIEIAVRERPDLLLIDLNMPEMDGYQAIARMRRELALTTMPIIVLTAEDGPGVERRVLNLGAEDYIVKPFDAGVLTSRVQAAFRRLGTTVAAAA
jgi:type II secretory ATPase GspE/PulE/Tfp pilus assembly ATPase PilB-like protein/ActR/RegA family two-component response regulator